ncbi:MAG TPA: hypothetical protein VFV43_03065 [Limnobacter sp.]|nr:hypothetical protein [Limnobacter sp.]
MSKIVLISGELSVVRANQVLKIRSGDAVFIDDQLSNIGDFDAVLEIYPSASEKRVALLKLLPGANAHLQGFDCNSSETGLVRVKALSDDGVVLNGGPLHPEDDGADCGVFGLFGGGLLAAGGGPLTAVAAAGGLYLFSGEGEASDVQEPPADANTPPLSPADESDGLAGAVDSVSEGFAQTPASPMSDALEPVAVGLTDVGRIMVAVGENDPTGVISSVAEIFGVSQSGGGSSESGVVGAINAVASGVESGGEDTPLSPVSEPVAGLLGADDGQTSGVAGAVSSVGAVMAQDDSALSPVTANLAGPIVGGSETDSGGLPAALVDLSEGVQALTAPGSAFSPLATVGEAVPMVIDPLAMGLKQVGPALDENRDAEPTGVVDLLAEVFGAPTEQVEPEPVPRADNTTSGLAGAVADVDLALEQSALEPLTVVSRPVADALLFAGESAEGGSAEEPTGAGQAIAGLLGSEETESSDDSGAVGAINAVASGVESGGENTPLSPVSEPVAKLLGSDDGQTSGAAAVVAELSGVIADDSSVFSPLTVEVLGPVLGSSHEDPEGAPGALETASISVSNAVADSPLAPVSPVTDGANAVVEQLGTGLRTGGEALAENASMDFTGSIALMAELLGAEVAQSAPEPEPEPSSSSRIGLAGFVQDIGTGAAQTPAAPVTLFTEPVSLALLNAGDNLSAASMGEPTGTAKLVANVIGTSDSNASDDSGISGGLNALAAGVGQGGEGNPVESIIVPVAELAGSRGGESTGAAAAIGAVGNSLMSDSSVASPLTSKVVAPLVGQSAGVSSGVPGAADKLASALSNAGSEGAFAPAAPVVEPVGMIIKTAADGGRGIGKIVSAQAQEDPSGVSMLVASLVGGGRGPGRPISRREVGDDGFDASSIGLDSLA